MAADSNPPLRRELPIWVCLMWLVGSSSVLLAASLLRPTSGRAVLLPMVNMPLPEVCTARRGLGIDCPGCGLTRSFLHMARGNVSAAWGMHPVGTLLFVFVVLQVPLASCYLAGLKHPRLDRLTRMNENFLIGFVLAIAVYWIVRIVRGEIF